MQVAYESFLYMYHFVIMRSGIPCPSGQLVFVCDPQELLGIVHPHLSQDILSMDTDGLLGNVQGLGDLPIAQARHDLAQDLHFPLGQFESKMEKVSQAGLQSGAHLAGLIGR